MFFFPLSAEIRGFKVLSYIPLKELPICSQVIKGKQSCVPRPVQAKLCCRHTEQPGSLVILIVRERRELAEPTSSTDIDLFSNVCATAVLHVMLKHYLLQSWLRSSGRPQSLILREIHCIQFAKPRFGNVQLHIRCRQADKTEPSAGAAEM